LQRILSLITRKKDSPKTGVKFFSPRKKSSELPSLSLTTWTKVPGSLGYLRILNSEEAIFYHPFNTKVYYIKKSIWIYGEELDLNYPGLEEKVQSIFRPNEVPPSNRVCI